MSANCSSKCVTRDHATFGECMRAKNLHLTPNLSNTGAQKAWDRELDYYDSARQQGLSPAGTTRARVDEAFKAAEAAS